MTTHLPIRRSSMVKSNELKFGLFPQPDLTASDYHLSPNLKKQFGCENFEHNKEVIDAVNEYFKGFNESDYENGITASLWGLC